MSHTGSNTLDLSLIYGSYLELKDEFDTILKTLASCGKWTLTNHLSDSHFVVYNVCINNP